MSRFQRRTRPNLKLLCLTTKIFNIFFLSMFLIHTTVDGFSPDTTISEEPTSQPTDITKTTHSIITGGSSSNSLLSTNDQSFKCKNLRTPDQKALCSNTDGFKDILIKAEKEAQKECEEQFRRHKWKCYGFAMLSKANITNRANKESSFVYALNSAILTRMITEACEMKTMNCSIASLDGLKEESGSNSSQDLEFHNVHFAVSLAERFLDSLELKRKTLNNRRRLNLHNNRLGRKVVSDNLETTCRCHGMSAGCTLKICKKTLPGQNVIAAILKSKYESAVRVKSAHNGEHFLLYDSEHSIADETDLIYFDRSPDFCFRDVSIGSLGVQGRECDGGSGTRSDTDSPLETCENTCCGRGFKEIDEEFTEQCCKFVWCCKVECNLCVKTRKKFICK